MVQDLFRGFWRNMLAVFAGRNLLWHALAAGLTAALVLSGADWQFFEATRSDAFYWIIIAAGLGGLVIPIIAPVSIYLWGVFRHDKRLVSIGAAVGQAALIAYIISTTYKAFTGRMQPEFLTDYSYIDITRDFNFGFLENGIFWGWPSSHTAVAFAGALVLFMLARSSAVRFGALLYAMLVAAGAAIGFHWFSDVVAGAIIGSLVGVVVIKSFGKDARR